MKTHKASYRWRLEELHRAHEQHEETILRPGLVMLVNIVCVVMAAVAVGALLRSGERELPMVVSAFVLTGFAAYWVLLRRVTARWWRSTGFRHRSDSDALAEFELSEEKVSVRVAGLASCESTWKVFIKVVETRDGFLFYFRKNAWYWLPFSSIEGSGGFEDIREWAKSSGVPYQQATG